MYQPKANDIYIDNGYIKANFDEAKQSQLPFVELLLNMGYEYLSRNEVLRERGDDPSKFILKDIALKKLMEINGYERDGVWTQFSEKEVYEAIERLEGEPYEGLIDSSQKIYNTVMPTRGGMTIPVLVGGKKVSKDFRFIDFEHPENNSFHATVEYEASGKQNIRPDILCFVNGIPFVIIENKKSSVKVDEALSQFNRNWGPEYVPRLYTYPQLMIGTNGKDARYGVTGTPNKFFAKWKEKGVSKDELEARIKPLIEKSIDAEVYSQVLTDLNGATFGHEQVTDRLVTEQDKLVATLLEPKRLLDITKNHILFDAGVKKISRYQQYFAIQKMLERIGEEDGERRKGGLVWHTQGSGKSLTMVLFVKALIEHPHIQNPRVIVVTDRRDLDKQISDTFKACNLKKEVTRATTAKHLVGLIKDQSLDVVTTLIHKFERAKDMREDFQDTSRDIFVLIDEAHRTQGGVAHLEMRRFIPNACYIGFTGTPLMTKERESWRKFGGYIDKYTIDDALLDGVIVPLVYEGRYVDLHQNAGQIDRMVDRLTKGLNNEQKRQLQGMIRSKIIKDNPSRITEIAYDIEEHYTKVWQGTGLKGQVVAPSKYSAVLFQKVFEDSGKIRTAVVISDENGQVSEEDEHRKEVVEYLDSIGANYKNLESYEKSVVDSFKHNEDGVELLIVVDKLLTGFDAPRNTVLYLSKDLKDHNLLQAIARVNRLFDNEGGRVQKTTGYIIDYSENAKNLKHAMQLFGNFEADDMKGTLIDVDEKIKELEEAHDDVHEMFKELAGSRDDEAYIQFLKDDQKRDLFYENMKRFVRVFKECFALQEFAEEFKEIDQYQMDLKKLLELQRAASLQYADRVDFGKFKQSLVKILDKYVNAEGVELLTKQISLADTKAFSSAVDELGSDRSKAEAIAAQTERTIKEEYEKDPEFFQSFSEKVKKVLEEMRAGKMADVQALKDMKELSEAVRDRKDEGLPSALAGHKGAGIFYRNLQGVLDEHGAAEDVKIKAVIGLYEVLERESIVDWYRNAEVKRIMSNKLDDYLYDVVRGEYGVELGSEEIRDVVERAMALAEHNHELF